MSVLLLFLSLVPISYSYNYLICIPILGHSHTNYIGSIGDILADAGHNVTILSPVVNRNLVNKTVFRNELELIMVDLTDDLSSRSMAIYDTMATNNWEQDDPLGMIMAAIRMTAMIGQICEETIVRKDILDYLREKHFDVGIGEPTSMCGFGIFDILDIPVTMTAISTPQMDPISRMVGQPTAPSYVPVAMSTSSERMSIWERFVNTIQSVFIDLRYMYNEEIRVLSKHYPKKIRSAEDMMASVSFQLINSNPLIDYPFPTIQKNVAIGGMQVDFDEENRLRVDEEWDAILSRRTRNVLISFGTIAKARDMPQAYKSSLLSVFESMPDTTFIWKYEDPSSDIVGHLSNVHLFPWVPQKALLGDSRLSLFITHGGLGSTMELAHTGKPAIMIPFFGDQTRNSRMLSRHGGAMMMTKAELKEPSVVKKAIEEVISETSYLSNATRLARMLRDQPVSARDLVLNHCEFAAKYGPLPQLDPYGRTLSFVEYFLLDIALILISLLIVSILLLIWLIRRCCCRKVKQE